MQQVLAGKIEIKNFINMTTEELATDDMKKTREADLKYQMEANRNDVKKLNAMTEEYKCEKCNQRKCSYYSQQVLPSDEPMTIFITCTICGNRWTHN